MMDISDVTLLEDLSCSLFLAQHDDNLFLANLR